MADSDNAVPTPALYSIFCEIITALGNKNTQDDSAQVLAATPKYKSNFITLWATT